MCSRYNACTCMYFIARMYMIFNHCTMQCSNEMRNPETIVSAVDLHVCTVVYSSHSWHMHCMRDAAVIYRESHWVLLMVTTCYRMSCTS